MLSVPKFAAYAPLFEEYARVAATGPMPPKAVRSLVRSLDAAQKHADTIARTVEHRGAGIADQEAVRELSGRLRGAAEEARLLVAELPAGKPSGAVDATGHAARLEAIGAAFGAADDVVRAGRGIGVPSLPAAPSGSVDDAARAARVLDADARIAALDPETRRLVDIRPTIGERLSRVFRSTTMQRLMRVRVIGGEHVPKQGGVVIAATHTGAADLVLTSMGHTRVPRIMAHHTLMRNPTARAVLERGGAFPVEPGNARHGLALMEAHLLRGNAVKVYPEGMMPRVDALGPAREGAALAAIRTGRPVVVQGEYGTRPARQYGESVLQHWTHRGGRGVVAYSEPIPTAHLDPRNRDHVTALAARIGDEQQRLREQARATLGH